MNEIPALFASDHLNLWMNLAWKRMTHAEINGWFIMWTMRKFLSCNFLARYKSGASDQYPPYNKANSIKHSVGVKQKEFVSKEMVFFQEFFKPFFPVDLFSTPWKHQKILRFPDVFRDWRKGVIGNKWVNKHPFPMGKRFSRFKVFKKARFS